MKKIIIALFCLMLLLGVTAVADSLPEAVASAYEKVGGVHFENAYFRRDIGARALAAKKV